MAIRPLSVLLLSISALGLGCSDYEFNSTEKGEEMGEALEGDDPLDTGDYTDEVPGDTASVTGRVCDPSGAGWVVGATVWAEVDYDGDGTVDDTVSTETDADGYFTLTGLPLGTHTIYIEKGSFQTSFEVVLNEGGNTELAEEECLDATDVEIAVVTGTYDSIQVILDDLGLEYTLYNGTSSAYLELLTDPDLMAEYDIIFFNCGMSDSWTTKKGEIGSNVKNYVEDGGSIYSSDWAYFLFEVSFPNALDYYGEDTTQGSAYVGNMGELTADVLDPNIMAIVGGSTAELNYDLGSWVVPESAGTNVEVLVEGTAPIIWGSPVSGAPLAARFEKNGTALYTTFHNERQITVDMSAILSEIILSL